MGGFVRGGEDTNALISSLVEARESFNDKGKVTKAQQLGIGDGAYRVLMENQAKWEKERDSGGAYSKQSPLMQQQMENEGLKGQLKMDDVKFAALMKEQSNWETRNELGDGNTKQSPVMRATLAAGAKPALDPGFDFVRK